MLLESVLTSGLTLGKYLLCTGCALGLGALTALVYMYKNTASKSFVASLVLLPAVVQTVILLVNGNLGAPGTAREITALFMVMDIGLAAGTGYLLVAALFTLVVGLACLALTATSFGAPKEEPRELKITIPESLDYEGLFDDLIRTYCKSNELYCVKTTNMGSLYELTYRVTLLKDTPEKELLDQIRARNGNLPLSLGRIRTQKEEL